jgi:hypothetical protein
MTWKNGEGCGGQYLFLTSMLTLYSSDYSGFRRNVNIGNPTRSLALEEPQRGDYLPVDDMAWEQGVSNWISKLLQCFLEL